MELELAAVICRFAFARPFYGYRYLSPEQIPTKLHGMSINEARTFCSGLGGCKVKPGGKLLTRDAGLALAPAPAPDRRRYRPSHWQRYGYSCRPRRCLVRGFLCKIYALAGLQEKAPMMRATVPPLLGLTMSCKADF